MRLMPVIPPDGQQTDIPEIPNPFPENRKAIGKALDRAGFFNRENPAPVSENAKEVLKRRYLVKDQNGAPTEDHLTMFQRVAANLAYAESLHQYQGSEEKRSARQTAFYEAMATLRFLPNSPTLMNAGRELQQLSACFVLPVDDSLESIFNAVKETAIIHKSGGGTGFAFSRLRPQGDQVGSTGGVASGPVSFIHSFDTTTDVVKQGGTRRGANMGVLHVSHPDILRFINAKRSGSALTNFNLSVAATDEFMEQAQRGTGDQELRNPRNNEVSGSHSSAELLDAISKAAWENGDPGLIFIDRVNNQNPNPELGQIEGTNPCITGDTWTMTAQGPRQVRDLTHQPVTLEWNGLLLPTSCQGFFPTGVREIVELNTVEGYQLRLTRDHPVLCADGRQWTPACRLNPGDAIQLSNPRNRNEAPSWEGPGDGNDAKMLARRFHPWNYNRCIPECYEKNGSNFWKSYIQEIKAKHGISQDDGSLILPFKNQGDRLLLQRVLLRLSVVSESTKRAVKIDQENLKWLRWALEPETGKPCQQPAQPLVAHVKSLNPASEKPVFDVQVPGFNAFEANGFTVHNCGEQPLLPYESCNLGSVNLAAMTKLTPEGATVDWPLLRETVETAVRMLDDVITMNRYPIPEIERVTKKTRRIGLGVMGLADMLIQLAIPYGTDEAAETAEAVLRYIRQETYRASHLLAQEKGPYPVWEHSLYCQEKPDYPLRNTAPTTIAPTGTISIIAGVSSGIEPIFAPGYVRTVMDGTKLPEVHPYIQPIAEHLGFYSDSLIDETAQQGRIPATHGAPRWVTRLFQPAHDIPWPQHIMMQAAAQRHCDNAVSKTINLPAEATPDDVKAAYLMAYRDGCKGITVYRDQSRDSQVLQTVQTSHQGHPASRPAPEPRPRPRTTIGVTEKVRTGHGNMYVTINYDEEQKPFEVFTNLGKAGGCDTAQMEAVSRLISMSLRAGIEASDIIDQLSGITCCPAWDNGTNIRSGPDAIAYALRLHTSAQSSGNRHLEPGSVQKPSVSTNQPGRQTLRRLCPDCHTQNMAFRENCLICLNCGWSRCE